MEFDFGLGPGSSSKHDTRSQVHIVVDLHTGGWVDLESLQ